MVEGIAGSFKAEPIIDGVKYKAKTYFPPEWTREKVVEKIFEAFQDPYKKIVIDKAGCHIIEGQTSEYLRIKIIFDPVQSLITTAYPLT